MGFIFLTSNIFSGAIEVAIINQTIHSQLGDLNEYSSILFICPICKLQKELKFPNSIIHQAKQLSTISIPKGLVCKHHFQAFVDKNFKVRGYQKVDFEYASDLIKPQKVRKKKEKDDNNELFDNLTLEGNFVEYQPRIKSKANKAYKNQKYALFMTEEVITTPSKKGENLPNKQQLSDTHKKSKMTLEDIYNEFWEFIDDQNNIFREFIKKDSRRVILNNSLRG